MRARAMVVVGIVVGASTPALGQPASQEAQLRASGLSFEPAALGHLSWSLSGQLTGAVEQRGGSGLAVADAGVGAELAIDSDACRMLVVGGQARLYRDSGDRGVSAEQWASACLMGGEWVPNVQLSHHLELDVRPAFSAPRTLRRRRYTRETIGFDVVELRFPIPGYDSTLEFGHLDLGVSFVVQDAGDEHPDALEADVDVAMLSWVRPRRDDPEVRVDVFGAHVREVDEDYYTFVMEFAPVRLRGIHLGRGLFLDAAVAWAHGSVSEANTVDSLPLRQYDTVTADVAVERRRGELWFGGGYRRQFAPTIDTDLIVEDRASGWAALARGRADYGARLFGARTQLFSREGDVGDPELTGGLELSAGIDLGHDLRLGASAEVARTFYARIDDESQPRPELAMRFVGLLSTRLGSD